MRAKRAAFRAILCMCACAAPVLAQEPKTACDSTAPPKYVLLVHQEFPASKAAARQELEIESARSFDRLQIPLCWIEMQAWTGAPGALFFDPFDSFEQLEKAHGVLAHAYAKHPGLVRQQEGIVAHMSSSRNVIAARRDDLGYRTASIDLSKVRYMRIVVAPVRPGYENEFVEAYKTLAAAYEEIHSPNPWVVYQVDSGTLRPTFLIIVPMRELVEMDTLLANAAAIRVAEGDAGVNRLKEIARRAYLQAEVRLYVVSPRMSHVSPAFAAGDPAFWVQKPPPSPKQKQ